MKQIYKILFFSIMSVFLAACSEDTDFSSSSSLRLEFSRDTVAFDTLFTEVGSPTAGLVVRNRNSDGLIWTAWGSKTPDSDTLKSENGYVVYGVSTAVALMYNCQQWWD